MQALLLAAGFGTRLRPHTLVRPKPLFPVLDRPLLHILLEKLRQAGCHCIVVNCHHLADQVQAALSGQPDVVVQYEPEILGTGGSLRRALERLQEAPVLVMNGDIFHTVDLRAVYVHHCRSGRPVTMVVHDYPRFNTLQVRDDLVRGFGRKGQGDRMLAFTGIHVLEPAVIRRIPEQGFYHIIDLYQVLAREGDIGVFRAHGHYWRDMGTAGDYLALHRDLLLGRVRGVTVEAGPAAPWYQGADVQLGAGVELRQWGGLGSGVRLGAGGRWGVRTRWSGALEWPL